MKLTVDIFRYDLNALRAIAVFLVVAFHFNIPGFGSGFIGVDIFFVITGYLMTSIIVKSIENHRFNLFEFYVARVVRLFPALVVLCFCVLIFGYFFLLASEYKTLGKHVVASLSFFSNIQYFNESGYFDVESHKKILLHTWSLSVEWQYYLIYPVLLLLVFRLKASSKIGVLLSTLCLFSFAVCFFTVDANPSAAFYLLPFRAWEILFGGIVFCIARGGGFERHSLPLSLIGYGLILITLFGVDKGDSWPDIISLLPVLGTGIVILANNQKPSIYRSFCVSELGKSSYSLYLWHWPVHVITGILIDDYPPSIQILAICLSVLAGLISYRLIEVPVLQFWKRKSRIHTIQKRTPHIILFVTSIAFFIGFAVYGFSGIPNRMPASVNLADNERFNRETSETVSLLAIKDDILKADVVLVGDSFAAALSPVVEKQARLQRLVFAKAILRGCKSIDSLEIYDQLKTRKCSNWFSMLRAILDESDGDDKAIIYVNSPDFSKRWFIVDEESAYLADNERIIENSVMTLCDLQKKHDVRMFLPIPSYNSDVPTSVARKLFFDDLNDFPKMDPEVHKAQYAMAYKISKIVSKTCQVTLLDPLPFLCPGSDCISQVNLRPIYYDHAHLSLFGAGLLEPLLENISERKD